MSKLSTIAANMRRAVASKPFGYTTVTLPGGLDIVLSHIDDRWRLALRRQGVFPSHAEAEILRSVFAVAEGTEPTPREKTVEHPETHRKIAWKIIEYNWIEADTAADQRQPVRLPRYASTIYPPETA